MINSNAKLILAVKNANSLPRISGLEVGRDFAHRLAGEVNGARAGATNNFHRLPGDVGDKVAVVVDMHDVTSDPVVLEAYLTVEQLVELGSSWAEVG